MWDKLTGFIVDVRGEFGRVIWPTRDELINSTTVVMGFSIAFAVFIGSSTSCCPMSGRY